MIQTKSCSSNSGQVFQREFQWYHCKIEKSECNNICSNGYHNINLFFINHTANIQPKLFVCILFSQNLT